MSEKVTIFLGNIAHCNGLFSLELLENAFLIVQGRKIVAYNKQSKLEETIKYLGLKNVEEVKLKNTQCLLPGLIDTHIHAPQYPNSGLGYDKPLLEWLDCYTYKLEQKYSDLELSDKVFNAVVKKTLNYGTTTACYFASMFHNSSMVLVEAAIKHGQRAFIGKINMTKLAPTDYIETPEETISNTLTFIEKVKSKKCDLVEPVITPRFALSVDADTMEKLGVLAKEHDLNIQTHISENLDEINFVKSIYNKSYADVYNDANLLTSKTVLAHGVHLTDEECKLIAQKGTSISHCPVSNTCLKSGLCDVRRLAKFNINVSLGTDIAGGSSPSIIDAMRSALDTSIHISYSNSSHTPLTWKDALYLATLGGAKALAIDNKVGNFAIGKDFDAIIVDVDVENSSADYIMDCNLEEVLQKFVYLGDDRNVSKVYVAGKCVKS